MRTTFEEGEISDEALNPNTEPCGYPEGSSGGFSCYEADRHLSSERSSLISGCHHLSQNKACEFQDLSPTMSEVDLYENKMYNKAPQSTLLPQSRAPMKLMDMELNARQPPPPPPLAADPPRRMIKRPMGGIGDLLSNLRKEGKPDGGNTWKR